MRKKWLGEFGLKEDDVSKNTLVCSNHFENHCYYIPNHLTGKKVLKKDSIPTLLLAVQKVKKTPRKRKLDFGGESSNTALESNSNMELLSANSNMELVSIDTIKSELVSSDNSEMDFVASESSVADFDGESSNTALESNSNMELLSANSNIELVSTDTIKSELVSSDNSEMDFVASGSSVLKTPKTQKRWRPAHVSQVDMEHGFDTPQRAKRHFSLAVDKIRSQKEKIIALNRQNRSLKAKVKYLETFLNHLKSKDLI
ncbi:uncharacterized protein LOC123299719 isoform X2 [Chrysoperla carnea]|nr:uncharacterized protein LOC123299719 isoform X2 [Chrysoperla carnea]